MNEIDHDGNKITKWREQEYVRVRLRARVHARAYEWVRETSRRG